MVPQTNATLQVVETLKSQSTMMKAVVWMWIQHSALLMLSLKLSKWMQLCSTSAPLLVLYLPLHPHLLLPLQRRL